MGGGGADIGFYLDLTQDGGCVISGYSNSYGQEGIYVLKLDNNFKPEWNKTININTSGQGGGAFSLKSGGYIIKGAKEVGGLGKQGYIAKLSSDGQVILWEKTYGSPVGNDYFAYVQELSDGSLILSGQRTNEANSRVHGWLVKTDANGNLLWEKTYYTRYDLNNYLYEIEPTPDGGFVVAGSASDFFQIKSFWLLKTDSLGNTCNYGTSGCDSVITTIPSVSSPFGGGREEVKVYPNPAKNELMIESPVSGEATIYNLLGSEVKRVNIEQGKTFILIEGMQPGVYLYRIISGGQSFNGKITILK